MSQTKAQLVSQVSDAQNNTTGGSNAGDSFTGTDANGNDCAFEDTPGEFNSWGAVCNNTFGQTMAEHTSSTCRRYLQTV